MNIKDIYWLAGLFDGEACFVWNKQNRTPAVQIAMTDEDTIIKVCKLLHHPRYYLNKKKKEHHKQCYSIHTSGKLAVGIMMTLYSLLSKRRQEDIQRVLGEWKQVPNRYKVGMKHRTESLNKRPLTDKQRWAF